jgi:hypothetical protein
MSEVVLTRRATKGAHAATIDKGEHVFSDIGITSTGQISYPMKIFNHLRSLAKIRRLTTIWKGLKTDIQQLTPSL